MRSSAPNPSSAMAQVLIDELIRNGVRHLTLGPGSRSAAMALAAASRSEMAVHVEIDERSAGFLALGIAKGGGGLAAVLTTSGTAAANLLPAVVEADRSATPLLCLTSDRPPELREVGSNQTIDQVKLYGDAVRWFLDLGVAEDRPRSNQYWRSTACRAVAVARGWGGRPGPVHLNLPFREPVVPLSDDGRTSTHPFGSELEGRADGGPWTRLVAPAREPARFNAGSGRRPLIVVGEQPPWPIPEDVPTIAEAPSGARRPGTITTYHHLLSHPTALQALRPDLLITVGRVGLSPHIARLIESVDRHLVVSDAEWPDPTRSAASLGPGALGDLDPEEGWLERWQQLEGTARHALDAHLDREGAPTEPRVARDVALAVPEGGLLFAGSSMPVRDLDWFMPAREIRLVANRGASGIDGAVSTALGAAIGSGAPMVALIGDLSLLHDSNGLLLDPKPDCVLVVVNNDGGGIFSFLPQAQFPDQFERLFGTPHGRDLSRLAQLHGAGHRLIQAAGEVTEAVRAAMGLGGVQLVEVRTNRAENVEVHRRATEGVHRAVDRHLD